MHGIPLNSVSNSLSCDIVKFKIEVGVDAKFTCKNESKQMRHAHYATGDARRPCFSIDLDFTVNMLVLCVLSNLLLVYPPRSDALFSNYFEDLLLIKTYT